MTPTIKTETPRHYMVRFENGDEVKVRADIVEEPSKSSGDFYIFYLGDVEVGKFKEKTIAGWYIKTP